MSTEPTLQKRNRTPWIVAGVLGCLIVCLLIAVAGGAFYFLNQAPTALVSSPVALATAPSIQPTQPPQPTQASQPTQAPLPTALPSATTSVGVPTLAPLPTLAPIQSGGLPTLAPLQGTQQTVAPPAASTARLAFTVRRGDRPEDNYVWIMNADGSGAKELLKRSSEPSFSPDGTKIAYYRWTDGIFVANAADGTDPKKVLGESNSGYLSWSHDGRWIAFSVRPGGAGNIATDAIAPDGTGRRPIGVGFSPYWTPDDTQIIFVTCRGSGCGIYKVGSGGGDAIPIITDDGGLPAMSPDGKRILYQKDDGQKQLFIINSDGSGKQQLTSGAALHVSANWSPDGNFIFYRSPEGGQWGIWRMNADGSNPVKIANDMPPGDWPYDRIAITK